jgi:hypothetical protein
MGKIPKTKAGVKLHLRLVFMEKGASYPEKTVLTTASEHDSGQLEIMVDDKECMYVFDRGYLDYERFDHMTEMATFSFQGYGKTLSHGKFTTLKFQMTQMFYRIKW